MHQAGVPAGQPLMAPNYVWSTNNGATLQFTERWDQASITSACAVNGGAAARCLDAVVRGALGALAPQVGPQDDLLPEQTAYLNAAVARAGLVRPARPYPTLRQGYDTAGIVCANGAPPSCPVGTTPHYFPASDSLGCLDALGNVSAVLACTSG